MTPLASQEAIAHPLLVPKLVTRLALAAHLAITCELLSSTIHRGAAYSAGYHFGGLSSPDYENVSSQHTNKSHWLMDVMPSFASASVLFFPWHSSIPPKACDPTRTLFVQLTRCHPTQIVSSRSQGIARSISVIHNETPLYQARSGSAVPLILHRSSFLLFYQRRPGLLLEIGRLPALS